MLLIFSFKSKNCSTFVDEYYFSNEFVIFIHSLSLVCCYKPNGATVICLRFLSTPLLVCFVTRAAVFLAILALSLYI